MQSVAEGGRVHLLAHGGENARIAVAYIRDHGAGRAVEKTPAVTIPNIHAFRAGDKRTAPAGLIKQMRRRFARPLEQAFNVS